MNVIGSWALARWRSVLAGLAALAVAFTIWRARRRADQAEAGQHEAEGERDTAESIAANEHVAAEKARTGAAGSQEVSDEAQPRPTDPTDPAEATRARVARAEAAVRDAVARARAGRDPRVR